MLPSAAISWRRQRRSQPLVASGHLLEGSQRLLVLLETDLKASAAMSMSELEVLMPLANAPQNESRPSHLADQCVMTSGGTTRRLDRLESTAPNRRVSSSGKLIPLIAAAVW